MVYQVFKIKIALKYQVFKIKIEQKYITELGIEEVWIRGESEYHSMEDAEELSELIKKKGIKTHILSDADWDEELGYIFQDMEV